MAFSDILNTVIKKKFKKINEFKTIRNILFVLFFIFVFMCLFSSVLYVSAVRPSGANYTEINTSRAKAHDPQSVDAIAGNVTELNIRGYTTTQSWQGYYGNVSGTIELADSSDYVFYNWSVASPEGEVYASTSDNVDWASISCFNMSNNTALNNLETTFNIDSDDVDGVNETFIFNNHEEFYTANNYFSSGQCSNTKLYNSSGSGIFDEVLLSDGSNIVFGSLLKEDEVGFNNKPYDFEMLVLEDGHGTDTSPTSYYFYVELE